LAKKNQNCRAKDTWSQILFWRKQDL
jgi:hypothetical protein